MAGKITFENAGDQRGQSLVHVLISMSLMSVVMLVTISMQVAQIKENKALGEKVASMDLARIVTSILSDPTICQRIFDTANLANPSSMPFDGSTIDTAHPYILALSRIPGGAGAVVDAIATAGAKVSAFAESLSLLPSSGSPQGIQVLVTSPMKATLKLNYDQTKLVRHIHDLEFPLRIQTAGSTNSLSIVGCQNLAQDTSFFAHLNSFVQNADSGVFTIIGWAATKWDSTGGLTLGTGRFTPTIPGRYYLHGVVTTTQMLAPPASQYRVALFKNNQPFRYGAWHVSYSGFNVLTGEVSAVVDANGSNDFFDIRVFQDRGTPVALVGDESHSYFEGFLLH